MADSEGTSFWKTLPGVLTAVTGTIGAIATLLTVLYQVGWIGLPAKLNVTPSGSGEVVGAKTRTSAGSSITSREAIVSQGFKRAGPNVAELEVTYTYDRSRQGVFVDAIILSKGRRISKGSPVPASQSTGRVAMRAVTNPDISQQSDEVEVLIYELGQQPFLRSRTPWSQRWGP